MVINTETAQIGRFGLVGVLATSVHMSVVLLLSSFSALSATTVHIIAYLTSFSISFIGHYTFTFKSTRQWHQALFRFLLISALTLLTSTLIVKLGTAAGFSPMASLLIAALSVPVLSYVLNKKVAF